jgi:hypothetical protein
LNSLSRSHLDSPITPHLPQVVLLSSTGEQPARIRQDPDVKSRSERGDISLHADSMQFASEVLKRVAGKLLMARIAIIDGHQP